MTHPSRRCPPPLDTLARTVALGLLLGAGAPVAAQGIELRSSPRLQEHLSPLEGRRGAAHVSADRITARPDMDLVLEGQAEIRRPGLVVRADRIEYDQTQDRLQAEGDVHVNRMGNVFEGPRVQLQADSFQGRFESPRYRLSTGGHGDARRIEFIDQDRMAAEQARYTTCRATPGPEWLPEWFMTAGRIRTDMTEGTGVAEDVQVHFKGLKSPTLPDVRFPLESNRASGLLSPLVLIDTVNGVDIMQPYYFDIAPNRDATLVPRTMSKRGLGLEGEFRYLEPQYSGQVGLNWLPNDPLRQQDRWGLTTQHVASLATPVGSVGTALSINRVSDDFYWQDFTRSYLGATGVPGAPLALNQRVLPSTGSVSWGRGGFSMTGLVQRWQTQQDVNAPITPPYDRMPQVTMRYGQLNDGGIDWSLTGETTRFEADYGRLIQATPRNGTRSYMRAQASRPWVAPWGALIPKLQLHASRYDLDTPVQDRTTLDRVVPTFSLDGRLVYERGTQWLGKNLVQTLEPRVFYVHTPFRDQRALPIYDTGQTDFNLSTIYSENPYVGQDRIVDNNVVTFGVNSRLFDEASGAELLRLGIAQRLRLTDQRVNLGSSEAIAPGDERGLSDLLVGASTRWNDQLALDGTLQLNHQTQEVRRTTLQARYNPGPYRLFNVAYRQSRLTATPSELIDIGWQWPLSDFARGRRPDDSAVQVPGQGLGANRWYSVGRVNYSIKDHKPVDMLVGFEYDAGCWLGRVAFERLQSTVLTATTRLMFQIELIGFARVGVSPLESLRRNIPRYQYLRDNSTAGSRFLQYE